MISMTGYGYSEKSDVKLQLGVEIKSWNNRYLDISVSLPSFLSPLEGDFREIVKNRVIRGKIELSIKLKELEEEIEVLPDLKAAESYMKALRSLAAVAGEEHPDYFSTLLNMEGVLKLVKNRDTERYRDAIIPLLDEALILFEASRRKEGESTAENIRFNLEKIEAGLSAVEAGAADLEKKLHNSLLERFEQLVGSDFDENRILSELAVLLMKYGIGEEISRLSSHLESFTLISEETGPVGKKLDFLCQEMNREVNTIGSKNTIIEIGHAVVGMKEAIENIREQLRNVE
jgi:uncharacterized protein (TIGR00255 family)